MSLTDANKNINLINKKLGRGERERQSTLCKKVENFKWLLRNKANRMDIDRNEIKRGGRESHKTCLNRVKSLDGYLKMG